MTWNIQGDRPIWQQLREELTRRIVTGAYPMGTRLPSVRDLAAEAGVNPNTMQRALSELERDALVSTNRTSGRFVTEDESLLAQIRRSLAKEHIALYLHGMETIGFTRAEATAILMEESQ